MDTTTLLSGAQGFVAGPMVMNGRAGGNAPLGPREIASLANMVANAFTGMPPRGGAASRDTRDVPAECRWPKLGTFSAEDYLDLYSSFSIAARVVEIIPKECWQQPPSIYEDDDPDITTPFEEDWDALGQAMRSWTREGDFEVVDDDDTHPAWEYLLRADILSGIGRYGIILLGLDDGLDLSQPVKGFVETNSAPAGKTYKPGDAIEKGEPITTNVVGVYNLAVVPAVLAAPKTTPVATPANGDAKPNGKPKAGGPTRKLLYLQCFPEAMAPVVQWEANWTSPRYQKPVMYLITFNDPNSTGGGYSSVGSSSSAGTTRMVHWTRVIHVADVYHHASSGNGTLATPRLQPVLSEVLDVRKVYGASAEGYWRAAFMGLGFEAFQPRPGEGRADVNGESIRKAIFDFFEGFDRSIAVEGGTLKPLAPGVVDPTPHIEARLESIAIKLDCPMRILKGSERGNQASSQDEEDWNGSLRGRNRNYTTPRLVVPFVGRLVAVGVCRPPKQVRVKWPDIGTQSDAQKADVALKKTQALAAYVAGDVETIYPPQEYMVDVMGMSDERAEAVAEAAVEVMDERDEEAENEQAAAAEAMAEAAAKAGGTPPNGAAGGRVNPAAAGGNGKVATTVTAGAK